MYLFILESIGTSELILIGLVALIIFGPRKLPQMLRTFGKTVGELRRSTDEFKKTWEREASLEDLRLTDEPQVKSIGEAQTNLEATISRNITPNKEPVISPEIKELSGEDFEQVFQKEAASISVQAAPVAAKVETVAEETVSNKRDWL